MYCFLYWCYRDFYAIITSEEVYNLVCFFIFYFFSMVKLLISFLLKTVVFHFSGREKNNKQQQQKNYNLKCMFLVLSGGGCFSKVYLENSKIVYFFSENKLNKLAILHHQRSTVKAEKTECCCGLDLYWLCVFYY